MTKTETSQRDKIREAVTAKVEAKADENDLHVVTAKIGTMVVTNLWFTSEQRARGMVIVLRNQLNCTDELQARIDQRIADDKAAAIREEKRKKKRAADIKKSMAAELHERVRVIMEANGKLDEPVVFQKGDIVVTPTRYMYGNDNYKPLEYDGTEFAVATHMRKDHKGEIVKATPYPDSLGITVKRAKKNYEGRVFKVSSGRSSYNARKLVAVRKGKKRQTARRKVFRIVNKHSSGNRPMKGIGFDTREEAEAFLRPKGPALLDHHRDSAKAWIEESKRTMERYDEGHYLHKRALESLERNEALLLTIKRAPDVVKAERIKDKYSIKVTTVACKLDDPRAI